ncbi:MAG: hypothetical protein LBH25_13985 [Fibromonadaceae bacterium]|jgi:hypothetical protein|nr:hypothetical protein [Fibromonadaceae bacterium]
MRFSIPVVLLCASIAFAQFDDDEGESNEWADFDYKHAGLSQAEFQNVKESGMSKDKLLHLLEIGVRPSEYLKQPWDNLGVSESQWLSEREKGMEDGDIDRTYKNQAGDQGMAYLSILLPSYYQWRTDEVATAVAMDILWLSSVGLTVFLYSDDSNDNKWLLYGVPFIAGVHVWSFVDAILSTLWDNNPDARNFSWGIVPTGKKSFAAGALLRF